MKKNLLKSFLLTATLTWFGCAPEQKKQPPVVIPVVSVAETPQLESELAFEFEVKPAGSLQSPKKPVMEPPVRRASRDPFAGKAKSRNPVPKETGTQVATAPPPSTPVRKKPKPKLSLEEPNYPTHQKERVPTDHQATTPTEVAMTDNEARPVYHPSVKLMQMVNNPWLDVRFFIEPDGSFQASLVKSTGDPILDRIILRTIKRWRWEPKTVNGRPVSSTVVLRLKRKMTPQLHQ